MEIISIKRKIYEQIDKSFGNMVKISSLKDISKMASMPEADRMILRYLMENGMIPNEDSLRIPKSNVLEMVDLFTQKFVFKHQQQWKDYGHDRLNEGTNSRTAIGPNPNFEATAIFAIAPKYIAEEIKKLILPHYKDMILDGGITNGIVVEKIGEHRIVKSNIGEKNILLTVSDLPIEKEMFEIGGVFANEFALINIGHFRSAISNDQLYLLETQSDLIQRKERVDNTRKRMKESQSGIMDIHKIFFEELLKLDIFDIAVGVLKSKYHDKKIFFTTGETQTTIEGWRAFSHKCVTFDEAKNRGCLSSENNKALPIFRDIKNKFKLYKLTAGARVLDTVSFGNETERKIAICLAKEKYKDQPIKLLYDIGMHNLITVYKRYVSIIVEPGIANERDNPELKRIKERQKKYKLHKVYPNRVDQGWMTSEDIRPIAKVEYFNIAA